jgi:chaperonin GroEL
MGKRIEFDESARSALRRGVEQLAGVVRVTLGPRGRNVVIQGGDGAPSITNDGLTIARDIELPDPFENIGVQLVREAAIRTGETAGDGTTTATVLAHAMVVEGLKAIAAGHNPAAVRRGMDRGMVAVLGEVRRQAREVSTREEIARVATVSGRQDRELGELVADALERVGRQGAITVEDGRGVETTLEVVEGVRFDRGYLSPYFVTQPETMEAVLDRPVVLLTDLTLRGTQDVVRPLEEAARLGRSLFVVAEDVEGEALATLVINRLRGQVPAVAVKAPESGERRRALLDDLAVLTGAHLIGREEGRTLESFTAAEFGRARRVRVSRDTTTLISGGGRAEAIRARLEALERELAAATTDYDRTQIRERISRLRGGIAVVRVGGATELEMSERRGRLEDAIAGARSAVEEGVVTGGGVTLLRAQRALEAVDVLGDERMGVAILRVALEAPTRQIAINAGEDGGVVVARIREQGGSIGFNALTLGYEDLDLAGILDPAKVARCSLQNAASIGALVLTTDAIVVESPPEETEEEGGEDEAE